MNAAHALGAVVSGLCSLAAERWANDDIDSAERLLNAALRVIGDDTYQETDNTSDQR